MERGNAGGAAPGSGRAARGFVVFAWTVLGYCVGVVVWGAYVRATGSGAGCGGHWPLCNGLVIPRSPQAATLIEFSHRVSSGLILVLVAALLLWALRAFPRGHGVRAAAWLSLTFTVSEALVGAGLVLFGLVAENASTARAVVIALHLLNTFLLLGCLALTALWAGSGRVWRVREGGSAFWLVAGGLAGMIVLGASGAVTALGDTLFPAASLAGGLHQDFSAAGRFMVKLRVFHPLIAVAVGIYLVLLARLLRGVRDDRPGVRGLADALTGLVVVQILAGVTNLLLLAPVWMQMVHLFLADAVWITLVLLGAAALSPAVAETEGARPRPLAQAAPVH